MILISFFRFIKSHLFFFKAILWFLLIIVLFSLGVLFHKYKFFPYDELNYLAKRIQVITTRNYVEKAIKNQLTQNVSSAGIHKDIETSLLPLKLNGISLSELHPFPKTAGGITVVEDAVVTIDRLGHIFVYQNGKVSKPAYPELPNNISSYVANSTHDIENFRVHDIEYVDFETSLAVSHEYYDINLKKPRLAVSIIKINTKTLDPVGSWRTVFRGDPLSVDSIGGYSGLGAGGRLAVMMPDKLLLTAGDYNQDGVYYKTPKVAQNTELSFGKIIAIDIKNEKSSHISLGHRNPQGLMVLQNGAIFSTEHGPAGGDELNIIKLGANYGWPDVSLGVHYGTYNWPNTTFPGQHGSGFTQPIFSWVPSVGISNLIQINRFDRRWDGDFLVASLKAMSLFRLRLSENRVLFSEPIWIGERIRDIVQLKDGTIVLWTDDAKLLFLTVDNATLTKNNRSTDFASPALAMCMNCHHFGKTNPTHSAPTLSNLVGRKVAADSFEKYSEALKGRNEIWTKESLRTYILDPNGFAKGTVMPKQNINTVDVEKIILLME